MRSFLPFDPLFVDSFVGRCHRAGVPIELTTDWLSKSGTFRTPAEVVLRVMDGLPVTEEEKAASLGAPHATMGRATTNTNYAPGVSRDPNAAVVGPADGSARVKQRLADASTADAIRLGLLPNPKYQAQVARNQALVDYYNGLDANKGMPTAEGRAQALAGAGKTPAPGAAVPPTAATANIAQLPGESMASMLIRMRAASPDPAARSLSTAATTGDQVMRGQHGAGSIKFNTPNVAAAPPAPAANSQATAPQAYSPPPVSRQMTVPTAYQAAPVVSGATSAAPATGPLPPSVSATGHDATGQWIGNVPAWKQQTQAKLDASRKPAPAPTVSSNGPPAFKPLGVTQAQPKMAAVMTGKAPEAKGSDPSNIPQKPTPSPKPVVPPRLTPIRLNSGPFQVPNPAPTAGLLADLGNQIDV